MQDLHLAYQETDRLRNFIAQWDEQMCTESPVAQYRWTNMALWQVARGATVGASTGIEGNPLTSAEVDEVLSGVAVDARAADIREVINYNRALDLANRAALRDDFEWTQELLRRLSATVMEGLEDDEGGEYRHESVTVGAGQYAPPEWQRLPDLMSQLVDWLRSPADCHPVIRAGLTHLNVVSIHPWLNGNGRTARIAGSLMLMRCGVGSPEILSVESDIRADTDRYFAVLQHTHGPAYQPDRHSATEWLEYFAEVCTRRLEIQARLTAAIQLDVGLLVMDLTDAGLPTDWTPILLSASLTPVRVTALADRLELSAGRVRSMAQEMARTGWLEAIGEYRGRRYVAGPRLLELHLNGPRIVDRFRGLIDDEAH
jgi:Fic family protein